MMRLYLFTRSPMSFGTLLHCRPRLPCMLLKTYCDCKQLENTTPGGFICKIPGNNLLIPSSILITTQRTNQGDLNVLKDRWRCKSRYTSAILSFILQCFEAHKHRDIILERGRILVESEMKSSCFSSKAIFVLCF